MAKGRFGKDAMGDETDTKNEMGPGTEMMARKGKRGGKRKGRRKSGRK